jgi:dihydrofolate synthase/folylpolyglutamate synthase
MTFEEAVGYLESFINYEKKPSYNYKTAFKLDRMKRFLSNLGNPQDRMRVIHVAGTKGKGSTSCFIAHILKEQGFRVGLYTSPHLVDFRERIRLFDSKSWADSHTSFPGMIQKHDFADLLICLQPQIDYFRRSFQNYGMLTFFEILTAMALKYFRDKAADFVVLETGLGGRLDATNAAASHVSVITPISYDHEHILGNTLAEIAFEKAGIIKSENHRIKDGVGVTVAARQEKEVAQVIRRQARAERSVLLEAGKHFKTKKLKSDLSGQEFFYRGLHNQSFFLRTRMLGEHQLANAACAIAACEALALHGVSVSKEAIAKGVSGAYWPGRLELVKTQPFVIFDGAHNRESAARLADFLRDEFKKLRMWLVLGICEDKDIKGVVEMLEPMADRVVLTRANNPRAADPHKMIRPFVRRPPYAVMPTVEKALDLIDKEIEPQDLVVVAGSLFVVGEAKAIWQK